MRDSDLADEIRQERAADIAADIDQLRHDAAEEAAYDAAVEEAKRDAAEADFVFGFTDAERAADALSNAPPQRQPGLVTIHRDANQRLISVSEISVRTLVALLDTVTAKGAQAKLQLALTQQELEHGLTLLDNVTQADRGNRAARRASDRGKK